MAKLVNPALFIGLGGTGHKVLLQLKKSILNNYGEMPPVIDMLCFDTDEQELLSSKQDLTYINKKGELVTEPVRFDNDEVYGIAVKSPDKLLKFDYINEWISPIVKPKITPSDTGAKQIRQMGRFAIFENSPENIVNKIKGKISLLNDISTQKNMVDYEINGNLSVHLVFSPCGGTGAGTFIDMVMNLKKLNPGLVVNGYLVMPEFYTGFPMTHSVIKNFYGSLIEIDHLMGKDTLGNQKWSNYYKKPYEVNYTGTGNSFNLGTSKFLDYIYLFDKHLENGKEILDVKNVYDRIGRILYMMVSGPGQSMQTAYSNNDDSDHPSSPETNGKRRNYSSMGISQIILDKNFLKQVKSSQIINKILNVYSFDNLHLDSETLNVFIDSNSWREDAGKDMVIDRLMPQNQLKYSFETVNPSEFGKESNVVIQTNVKNLLRDIDLKVKTNSTKISDEIFEDFKLKIVDKITSYLKDKGGVSECKQFLSFMIGSFQGMANEMNEEVIKHASNKTILEKNLIDFVTAIQEEENSFNPIGKKGRIQKECENYVGQSEKILLENWQIVRKEAAKLFYDKCLEQLKEHQKNINNFADLLVEANTQIETEKIHLLHNSPTETDFETYIHTYYKDLVALDESDVNIEEAFRGIDFSTLYQLNKVSDVINTIRNFVNQTDAIKSIDLLSVEKILSKLPEETIKNIVSYLDKSSSVCIDIDSASYLNNSLRTSMQKFGFICVQNQEESLFRKGGDLQNNIKTAGGYTEFLPFSTNDPDRISMIKIAGMFPACAIKNMENYKSDFEISMKVGGTYHYSDVYFEKYAMDLIDGPTDDEGEAQKWFTVGSALGKIYLEKGALILKDENERPIQLSEGSRDKTNRVKCAEIFSKNKEYSKYIEQIYDNLYTENKPELIKKFTDFYKNITSVEILGKQFSTMDKLSPEWQNVYDEKKILKDFGLSNGIAAEKFEEA